ncbi:hypothetical protein SELMODRAFT_72177, partial [Selaginella moellendorffii]
PELGSSLVSFYGKCGGLDEAMNIFQGMEARDTVLYTAVVAAHADNGQLDLAMEYLQAMELQGNSPDQVTFKATVSACAHGGMLDDGLALFGAMLHNYSITPTLEMYSCIIDVLARAGKLRDVEELIRSMPFEPDAAAWTSVLSACRLDGGSENRDLGLRAAQRAAGLSPTDSAPYVMLANL